MRSTIIVALLLMPASLSAQTPPCAQPTSSVLQFDPYKPSDLAVVRNYGGTVLAQAPLNALLKLDPYVPSEGALLRQLGGSIPIWAYGAYPWTPPIGRSASDCESVRQAATPELTAASALTTLQDVMAHLETRPQGAVVARTDRTSARHTGVSIEFDGRLWTSAGAAVPFTEKEFLRVGERAGSPIFRRADRNDQVIYVRTTPGMVAPFRQLP